MAKDTIIDEQLAQEQQQKWGLPKGASPQQEPVDGQNGEPQEPQDVPFKSPSKLKEFIGAMLSGSILSKKKVSEQYPYVLFLALLMMLYIANTFRMQNIYRTHEALVRQVKELRSKSVTLSANLASASSQSAIIEELKARNIELKESVTPPIVISK